MLTLALPVHAAQSYSHLYIAISDALMNTKQDKEAEAKQALEQFAVDWDKVSSDQTEAKPRSMKFFSRPQRQLPRKNA